MGRCRRTRVKSPCPGRVAGRGWTDTERLICMRRSESAALGRARDDRGEGPGSGQQVCRPSLCFVQSLHLTLSSTTRSPEILPFDRIHPSPKLALDRPPRSAILYASPVLPNFHDLRAFLYSAPNVRNPHLEYVLRHIPPTDHASREQRTYHSGYGVLPDLKKMDHLALDDHRQGAPARISCMRMHLH